MGGALPNSPPPIESRYSIDPMTTPLTKLVKRELKIKGHAYIVSMSPDGLKIAALEPSEHRTRQSMRG